MVISTETIWSFTKTIVRSLSLCVVAFACCKRVVSASSVVVTVTIIPTPVVHVGGGGGSLPSHASNPSPIQIQGDVATVQNSSDVGSSKIPDIRAFESFEEVNHSGEGQNIISTSSVTRVSIPFSSSAFFGGRGYPEACRIGMGKSTLTALQRKIRQSSVRYGLKSTGVEIQRYAEYAKYGASMSSCLLGEGERLGVISDIFEVLGRTDAPIVDLDRLASGSIPLTPSKVPFTRRQKVAQDALRQTLQKTSISKENTVSAYYALMYRVRPGLRSLSRERVAIYKFTQDNKRLPRTSIDWAKIRVIAYLGRENTTAKPSLVYR